MLENIPDMVLAQSPATWNEMLTTRWNRTRSNVSELQKQSALISVKTMCKGTIHHAQDK